MRVSADRSSWLVAALAFVLIALLLAPGSMLGEARRGASAAPLSALAASGVRPAASGPTELAQFVISNGQPFPTGTFEQPIHLTAADFAGSVVANCSNVVFSYTNGTTVPAWIEGNSSSLTPDGSYLVWLHLGSIAGDTSAVVQVWAYPTSTFVLSQNGSTGEAPELSGSYGSPLYGAWDNGAQVFPFYENFAGTTLPSGWTASSGLSYSQDGGLYIRSESNNDPGLYSTKNFTSPSTFDFYGGMSSTGGVTFSGLMSSQTGTGTCLNFGDCRIIVQSDSRSQKDAIVGEVGNQVTAVATSFYSKGYGGNSTWTINWNGSSTNFEENYSHRQTVSYSVGTSPLYWEVYSTGNVPYSVTPDAYYSWVRERAVPPNGLYPNVTLVFRATAPTGVSLAATGTTTLYFAWSNPVGESLVSNTIYLGLSCGSWFQQIPTAGATQAWLFQGLTANTTYCAAVGAWNGTGESPLTAGVTARTNANPTVVPVPLSIASFVAAPPTVTVGGSTVLEVIAAGGQPQYSYVYPELPPGCVSASTDSLACTPTVAGTYTLQVNVTDQLEQTVSATTTLVVQPQIVPPPQLAVNSFTAAPATLQVGNSTVLKVNASGGSPTYSYVYTGLPAGCDSSSQASIICAPTAAGNYTIAVMVTDARGVHAWLSTSLTVQPLPVVPVRSTSPGPSSSFGLLDIVLAALAAAFAVLAVIGWMRRPGRAPPSRGAPPPRE